MPSSTNVTGSGIGSLQAAPVHRLQAGVTVAALGHGPGTVRGPPLGSDLMTELPPIRVPTTFVLKYTFSGSA